MQKLKIHNFGPIEDCDITINDFLIFTGSQASGKSTVAKWIYFFNNLKNILFDIVKDYFYNIKSIDNIIDTFSLEARNILVQSFGADIFCVKNGYIEYQYDNSSYISISITVNKDSIHVNLEMDTPLKDKFNVLSEKLNKPEKDIRILNDYIFNEMFGSELEIVYIPAGRSLLTMLAPQISYIYAVMDDRQKKGIDYCTRRYLEEVLRIKNFFGKNSRLNKIINEESSEEDIKTFQYASYMMNKILNGEYRDVNGEEKLFFEKDRSVGINYASSGQQEAVWILNILYYYMVEKRKTLFIIEEPETHLYPDAQKTMVEFISLVKNGKNKVVITTHSPYILGNINNLLYADNISKHADENKINDVIPRGTWLSFDDLGAFFIENGRLKDIRDTKYRDIDHGIIDGASSAINDAYEAMVSIKEEAKKG